MEALLVLVVIVCLCLGFKVWTLRSELAANEKTTQQTIFGLRGEVSRLQEEKQQQGEEIVKLKKKLERAENADRATLIDLGEEKARAAFFAGQLQILAGLKLLIETVVQERLRGLKKNHYYLIRLMIGERTFLNMMLPAPGPMPRPLNLLPGVDIINLLP